MEVSGISDIGHNLPGEIGYLPITIAYSEFPMLFGNALLSVYVPGLTALREGGSYLILMLFGRALL